VADFIFTRCGAICPGMTTAMSGLEARAASDLRFVSFTVDPTYDTPEVLARYAAAHHATPRWRFVTGRERELLGLAVGGFHLMAAQGDPRQGDAAFVHSAQFVLVDGEGWVRGYYDSDDPPSLRRLLRDAALVGRYGKLPRINATLNATSATLLALGYLLARRRRFADHRNCMAGALVSSTLFLACYVSYHLGVGSIRYPGEGWFRTFYLALLGSHTALAAAIVPLTLMTVTRALRARFDGHRRIARVTLPVWIYVSVTGVVVYGMLYRA
jgi:protein SCO1